MTSREYLEALGEALSTLVPDRERSETLRYYEEYFEEAGPEREAELMEELGSPEDLARKIAREGGFSGGPEEPAPKRHLNRWKWVAGITAAVVLVLAGTFAALSMFNTQLLDQANDPGGAASGSLSDDTPSDAPALGTETQPGEESQQPSQDPADPGAAESFVRLDIEIAVGDVTVRTGADWGLTLESSGKDRYGEDYLLHHTLEDQELTIWSTPRSLETDENSSMDGRVVVTVPEGWTLERVDIKNGMGAVELDSLVADEITAKMGMGFFEGDHLTAGELDVYNGMGKIALRGPIAARTELETGMGSVDVDTDSALASCAYDLESAMGSIRIDGTTYDTPQQKTEGELSLTASSGMGDITVDFGG